MSELTIIGIPQSTYVRVARMAAEEKGVGYALVPEMPHSDTVNAIHPFGRVPVMNHGDVELCESRAIASYIDSIFDGPSLISDDPLEAAETEKWISLVNTKMDGTLIRTYLFHYLFPKGENGEPDRAGIDEILPEVEQHLSLIEDALDGKDYLVGGSYSLADINLMPILAYLQNTPEAGQRIAESPILSQYVEKNSERSSFKNTVPPPPASE